MRTGQTVVDYPATFDSANQVTSVNVLIDHPDFCVTDYILQGSATRENKLGTARLERGTKIRLQAFDSVASRPSDNVHVRILASKAATPPGKMTLFELEKKGPDSAKTTQSDNWYESRRLPSTARRLVAIVLQDDRFPLFSPVLRWSVDNPASHLILTTVEPGVRFEGTIDPAVPRPVKMGRVMAHATTPPQDVSEEWSCSVWSDIVPVAEDGTFVLESMPRGCDLQLVAICEGWRSEVPDEAQRIKFASKYDSHVSPNDSRANPQTWPLEGEVLRGTIRMSKTASCRIRCVDRDQEPLAGLKVGFSPNHYFPGVGSWLFAVGGRSVDWMKAGEYVEGPGRDDYSGVTDADGFALVRNLPPVQQRFGVLKDKQLMSLGSSDEASVTPRTDSIVETTVTVTGPIKPDR
jgi:hypothetical protein